MLAQGVTAPEVGEPEVETSEVEEPDMPPRQIASQQMDTQKARAQDMETSEVEAPSVAQSAQEAEATVRMSPKKRHASSSTPVVYTCNICHSYETSLKANAQMHVRGHLKYA